MNEALPPLRRLIPFAVLLPAVVVTSNMVLLNTGSGKWLHSWFYLWMIFSVAILSWNAGRYLRPVWLSWVVFAWSIALLDLLTVAACAPGLLGRDLGYVLVSAQISLVVLWAILGAVPWPARLPVAALSAPFIHWLATRLYGSGQVEWNSILFFSAGVLVLLCLGLRYFGFLFQHVRNLATDPGPAGKASPAIQFGVRHMLLWLTVAGPLLLVLRSINVGTRDVFPVILLGACIATLNLNSIWAVLGGGPVLLRAACLFAIPFAMAKGLMMYSDFVKGALFTFVPGRTTPNPPRWSYSIMQMHDQWMSWFLLAAALLAALLLFLRESGYRLLRASKKSIKTASLEA